MGHCISKSKFTQSNPPISLAFDDLKVERSLKDSLPIPRLRSRLASAIVLSFHGRKKKVIKDVLVLSRASHAYIISQEGLPGFLMPKYDTLTSLMFSEFEMTRRFIPDVCSEISIDLDSLLTEIERSNNP